MAPSLHDECAPWASGQTYGASLALAELLCRTIDRIDPARVCGSFDRLERGASAPHPASLCSFITMKSERIGHWIKTRRSRARFSELETSVHARSLADSSPICSGLGFSVHTRSPT